MAKIDELTIGIVTKVMIHVGYTIVDRRTGEVRSRTLFKTISEANEKMGDNPWVVAEPVYREENSNIPKPVEPEVSRFEQAETTTS